MSSHSKWYHYFVDRIPLCNGCTMLEGRAEQGNDDSDENCPRCKKLLAERRKAQKEKVA
jgi:hypothetical protein